MSVENQMEQRIDISTAHGGHGMSLVYDVNDITVHYNIADMTQLVS